MESGFCNRAEILGIRKSGDIKNFEYDDKKDILIDKQGNIKDKF